MSRSATLKGPAVFAEAAPRSRVGRIIIAMMDSIGSFARRAYAHHRQRKKERAAYDALRHLDDRMLRDLGFDRSEIASVAAEVSGTAERTRVRVLLMSHNSP